MEVKLTISPGENFSSEQAEVSALAKMVGLETFDLGYRAKFIAELNEKDALISKLREELYAHKNSATYNEYYGDLIIEGIRTSDKIKTIKGLRCISQLDLTEAKAFVENEFVAFRMWNKEK